MTTTLSNHSRLTSSLSPRTTEEGGGVRGRCSDHMLGSSQQKQPQPSASGNNGNRHHHHSHGVGDMEEEDADVLIGQDGDIFEDEEIASVEADGTATTIGEEEEETTTVDKQMLTAALVSSIVELSGGRGSTTSSPLRSGRDMEGTSNTATHSPEMTRRKSPRRQRQVFDSCDDGPTTSSSPMSHDAASSSLFSPNPIVQPSSAPRSEMSFGGRIIYQDANTTRMNTTTLASSLFSASEATGETSPNANHHGGIGYPRNSNNNHHYANSKNQLVKHETKSLSNKHETFDKKCRAPALTVKQQQEVKIVPQKKKKVTNKNKPSSPSTPRSRNNHHRGTLPPQSVPSLVPNPLAGMVDDKCENSTAINAHPYAFPSTLSKDSKKSCARSRVPRFTKKTNTLMSAVASQVEAAQQVLAQDDGSVSLRSSSFYQNNAHIASSDAKMTLGGGQIMANIAESMFSQHYQADGLMAAAGTGGEGFEEEMAVTPHERGRIFSIDLDRECMG